MIKKVVCIDIIIIIGFISIFASQGACLDRADAIRASQIIRMGKTLRKFCPPCGDTMWRHISVKRVSVKQAGSGYSVYVNGRRINIKYYYTKINGNWVNIAMLLGIDVPESLEFLPAQARIP
ncbi:hypothetical protein QUF76_03750 [Desulfobacterales bacterium HSG16]|nr:hypothetical protein [Desulfobacterales bacterium HSG16]